MVLRCQAENGVGVKPTAKIAAHRNVSPQPNADGFFQNLPEFVGIVGIRTLREMPVGFWIIEVPIRVELKMLIRGNEVVSRRDLKYTIKKRTYWVPAKFNGVINGFGIPP